MTREEKQAAVADLVEKLGQSPHFYVVDIAGLNAADTSALRRLVFEKDLSLCMVKNTLFRKALEQISFPALEELNPVLKDSSSIIFSSVGNSPAKLIKEFRKTNSKPLLKAAYVEESLYIGDSQLDALSTLKSREELIADVISLLQSPAKRVLSALQSGGNTIAGLVKALSERDAA